MSGTAIETPDRRASRRQAVSQWDTEGGAGPDGPQESTAGLAEIPLIPELTNAELVQLRIRVIALENLVLALLSGASVSQLEAANDMAEMISPQPDAHQHPLTLHAATQMLRLLGRGGHVHAPRMD
jgi:hypothetical protein